jgi:hypothetical protein
VTARSKFDPQFPIVDSSGKPTQSFRDYMRQLDAGALPLLINAANDAAAAAAGVPVNYMYRNGSVLQVRVV